MDWRRVFRWVAGFVNNLKKIGIQINIEKEIYGNIPSPLEI